MKFETVKAGNMDVNTYLISTDTSAVIIDPGEMCLRLEEFTKENKGKKFGILLTHNHFDHILAADAVRNLTGGKIYISVPDADGLSDGEINLCTRFCIPFTPFKADCTFNDGDVLKIGDIEFKVMLTPGHSEGSACFIIDNKLFSGDTLFRLSVGRTDFIRGNYNELTLSLKKIASLNADYEVYTGHGPATRLSFEKLYNPFMKDILK